MRLPPRARHRGIARAVGLGAGRGTGRGTRRGFTLIDLLVVITITGTIAGTMTVIFSDLAARSAMTLRSREATVLAEAVLAEVKSMPFTYCDPNDANVTTAQRALVGAGLTRCAAIVEGFGSELGETRYGPGLRLDNVNDYNGFAMPGPGCATLCDRNGAALPVAGRLASCALTVNTPPTALPGRAALDADGAPQALRVVVTVQCPGMAPAVAEATRVRHAPNSR